LARRARPGELPQSWPQTSGSADGDAVASGRGHGAPSDEDTVVVQLKPYTARYQEQAARFLEIWKRPAPPLPQQTDPWHLRRRAIGRLAAHLFHTWYDWEIARLLTELGVRSDQSGTWYPQRVAYYRRAYGRPAA
jgi:hypothetical protein